MPMSINEARIKMAANRPKVLALDYPFFSSMDAAAAKLDATQGHPADWRRLREQASAYKAKISAASPFTGEHQAAFDYIEARMAYCDAKIEMAPGPNGLAPRAAVAAVVPDGRALDVRAPLFAGAPSNGGEHVEAFKAFLRNPGDHHVQAALRSAEGAALESGAIRASGNTLTGAAGGFAVPVEISQTIANRVKEISPLRQLAAGFSVNSTGTRFLVNRNNATSAWVGETGARTGTTEPTLDNRAPTYGTVYAYVEATEELLLDSAVDVGQWFMDAAVQQIAQAEGAAFVSGDGSNKPTGFLAGPTPVTTGDATRASGTLQYVPSVVTDTALGTFGAALLDALTNLFFATKALHRTSGSWLMNSAVASIVAKIRDGEGRHIWQQALSADMPNTLLGRPVFFAEDMPNWGANNFPIAFGNFGAGYLIADSGDLRITLDDNITTPGLVRWYLRRRVGGVIYDSEAIKLLKVSAT